MFAQTSLFATLLQLLLSVFVKLAIFFQRSLQVSLGPKVIKCVMQMHPVVTCCLDLLC